LAKVAVALPWAEAPAQTQAAGLQRVQRGPRGLQRKWQRGPRDAHAPDTATTTASTRATLLREAIELVSGCTCECKRVVSNECASRGRWLLAARQVANVDAYLPTRVWGGALHLLWEMLMALLSRVWLSRALGCCPSPLGCCPSGGPSVYQRLGARSSKPLHHAQ
jgi:hypothetical protein